MWLFFVLIRTVRVYREICFLCCFTSSKLIKSKRTIQIKWNVCSNTKWTLRRFGRWLVSAAVGAQKFGLSFRFFDVLCAGFNWSTKIGQPVCVNISPAGANQLSRPSIVIFVQIALWIEILSHETKMIIITRSSITSRSTHLVSIGFQLATIDGRQRRRNLSRARVRCNECRVIELPDRKIIEKRRVGDESRLHSVKHLTHKRTTTSQGQIHCEHNTESKRSIESAKQKKKKSGEKQKFCATNAHTRPRTNRPWQTTKLKIYFVILKFWKRGRCRCHHLPSRFVCVTLNYAFIERDKRLILTIFFLFFSLLTSFASSSTCFTIVFISTSSAFIWNNHASPKLKMKQKLK